MNRIVIHNEVELAKLIAFIRLRAHHVTFELIGVTFEQVVARLEDWAKENDVRVRLRLRTAEADRVLLLGVGAAALGATLGGMVAGLSGALVGGGIGAVAGAAWAHVELEVHTNSFGAPRTAMISLQ